MLPPPPDEPETPVQQSIDATVETPQVVDIIEQTQEHDWRDEIETAVEAAQVVQKPATSGLLKPVLDLSHIDKRNRPFLVWSEVPSASGYRLQEADNPDFNSAKESKTKADETKWHPAWGRSGRLFYRVQALRDRDEGPWSDVLSIRIGGS
jgi:hypothetical protein